MLARRVRAERERAAVLAVLHRGADQAQLRVGGVQHHGRALEVVERLGRVSAFQLGLRARQQRHALRDARGRRRVVVVSVHRDARPGEREHRAGASQHQGSSVTRGMPIAGSVGS